MPTVSVILAAYNAEKTIGEALTSMINQTFCDWEALLVDDASTDNTVGIISPFLRDPRLRLIRNSTNVGSGASRNRAIAEATSPLLAIFDADDISLPTRLTLQVARFADDANLAVLSGRVADFGDWGGPTVGSWQSSQIEIARRIKRSKMPVAHCAAMMRTEAVRNAGGYDVDCLRAQDFALFRKLHYAQFSVLDQIVVLYRTNRPIRLLYAIESGRYGRLARIKTRLRRPKPFARVQMPPFSFATDCRSVLTWLRRRALERL